MGGDKKKVKIGTFEKLACGATAGAVGKSVVAPFQRVQILFQVKPGEKLTYGKAREVCRHIVKNEGITAFWRGNVANAGRSAPTAAIKFAAQARYYTLYNEQLSLSNGTSQFLSGASSGVTTVISTYPLDLFRTKLAANSQYKGYADCARQTVKAHGVRGLFHGMSAPVVGSIPHTGIAFWTYDYLKTFFGVDSGDPSKQSPFKRSCAGFLAGFAGQTVTYPFSTIRRRMQTSPEWQGKGLFQCFKYTIMTEGVKGLFRAYSIHAFKGPISAGISFAMNDILKNYALQFRLSRLADEDDRADYLASKTTQAQ